MRLRFYVMGAVLAAVCLVFGVLSGSERALSSPQQPAPNECNQAGVFDPSPEYTVYRNDRYGFSIEVPLHFLPGIPPTNGDGQSYTTSSGDAAIKVYGSNNLDDTTGREQYDRMITEKAGKLGYHVCSDNWFVVTWEDQGAVISYHKSYVGTGSSNSFVITYPREKMGYYEQIVERMERTFRSGDLSRAH